MNRCQKKIKMQLSKFFIIRNIIYIVVADPKNKLREGKNIMLNLVSKKY